MKAFLKFLLDDLIQTLKNEKGFVTALGLAALGAGAGFGLSKFMKRPKEAQQVQPSVLPYQSVTEFPVGRSLNQSILSGLGGQSWGYPADYTSRATSPFIAQREAQYPKERAALEDLYAGRGLGKSTVAARGIGEAYSQKERDINQIMAQAYEKNILQGKTDEANALSRALQFSQLEAGTRGQAAGLSMNQAISQAGYNQQYDKDIAAYQARQIGIPLSMAGQAAGIPGLGSMGAGIGGFGGGQDSSAMLNLINQALQAQPFTNAPGRSFVSQNYSPESLRPISYT